MKTKSLKRREIIMKTQLLLLGLLCLGILGCQDNTNTTDKKVSGPEAQAQELSLQEQMIHRRAVEAAVWGMPIEGTRGLLLAARSDLGGDWNDVIYFSKPMESRHGFLTANNQVPYVIASLNTKDGPLVLEVPGASDKAKFFGSLVDVWDYPFTDVGPHWFSRCRAPRTRLSFLAPWLTSGTTLSRMSDLLAQTKETAASSYFCRLDTKGKFRKATSSFARIATRFT